MWPFLSISFIAFLFARLKIEFEYSYADGPIDFDRIRGNAKRKPHLRVDLENAEIVALSKSSEIQANNDNNRIKIKDFSPFDPEAKIFAMIVNKNGELYKIIFEPSKRLITSMKRKQPRKAVQY